MIDKWNYKTETWFKQTSNEIKKVLSNNELTYEQAKCVLNNAEQELIIRQDELKIKD
ncbi:hypothetical protein [Latilactobacillus sakei]|uniref:hypothetical protein n=1 Tax=Latilactobacillus sakei TaxID=1599 RepID=UPI000DC6424F|nr:hypothetical protein [Latilactobacillus sakei]SPS04294.1 hypothetical protein LAS9624_01134 [Latilactobacillus sakei]